MNIRKYPIPKTRDPFINTPFVRAGFDPETGEERFWTGSWNANAGMTGVLVTPSGKNRVYRFEKTVGFAGSGSYSAAYTGNETIWLMSDTMVIRRLDLRTGKTEDFLTGAAPGLVFACMPYDEATGKLLFLSNVNTRENAGVVGVSFDTRTCKTVRIYENFTGCHGVRGGFPNGDGTYTIRFVEDEHALWRWDPRKEELVRAQELPHFDKWFLLHSVGGELGHYVPYAGWYDGYTLSDGPKPDTEMQWFGRSGNYAFGLSLSVDDIWRWDMTTGKVSRFCACADISTAILTADGYILAMSLYGMLYKFDMSGSLIMSVRLDTDSVGYVDCIAATDNGKIVGTPFITERFWVFDEATETGYDAGRVAYGIGETMVCLSKNGKVYLANYNQGILTEYDPSRHAAFPDNPRVVAKHAKALRPKAITEDADSIYYAANHYYGTLGCVLSKYNTRTGESLHLDDPMPPHSIRSLYYADGVLWSGATWKSDARSTAEPTRETFLAKHDPQTLQVLATYPAPDGTYSVFVHGKVDSDLLVTFPGEPDSRLHRFDPETGVFTPIASMPEHLHLFYRTGRTNEYVAQLHDGTVQRWLISASGIQVMEDIFHDDNLLHIFPTRSNGKFVLCASTDKDFYVIRDLID